MRPSAPHVITPNYYIGVLEGHTDEVKSATFSPDGTKIVSASWDNSVKIWDATTGQSIGLLIPQKTRSVCFFSAFFSPDGKKIVSASHDHIIRIWNVETERQIGHSLEGHTGKVWYASFSPDGTKIISAGDTTIRIWDAFTGKQIRVLEGHQNYFRSAVFSPDSKKIVSAAVSEMDRKVRISIRIWDATNGKQIGQLQLPEQGRHYAAAVAAFNPDGTKIISSGDKTIRIWDANTGIQKRVLVLEGHILWVSTQPFSPDGKFIVSYSEDGSLRIWNSETGEQIGQPLYGHKKSVNSASFSPDGKRIVSASDDKTVRIWDVSYLYN